MINAFNFFKKHLQGKQSANVPAFLIIGAQKAGTTTLFDMLNNIEGLSGSAVKEPGFFSKDKLYKQGNGWYLKHFSHADKNDLTFEATPEYLYYPFVPNRIFHFNPQLKFIVIFREPAARCLSAWNMFRMFNKKNPKAIYEKYVKDANLSDRVIIRKLLFSKNFPDFEDAVLDELNRFDEGWPVLEPSFVRRGLYYQQLMNYLKYFDIANFLFIEQNELSFPIDVLSKLGKFLGIKIDMSGAYNNKTNVGVYDPFINNKNILEQLKNFYHPHNENLFGLIGRRFRWNEQ